jgi:hypothetical protein
MILRCFILPHDELSTGVCRKQNAAVTRLDLRVTTTDLFDKLREVPDMSIVVEIPIPAPPLTFNNGYTGYTASAAPSIVAYRGLFHVFFRDGAGNGLMHITSPDGITWSTANPFHPDFTTSDGPCAVVIGTDLHVFFRDGTGNGILHIVSSDGSNFHAPDNWYIGLNCDGQPSAAVNAAGAMCLVAIDHGGSGIMRSVAT